jgi:hypothetical protein
VLATVLALLALVLLVLPLPPMPPPPPPPPPQGAWGNPAGRIGYPSDIANAVLFLASGMGSFVNGSCPGRYSVGQLYTSWETVGVWYNSCYQVAVVAPWRHDRPQWRVTAGETLVVDGGGVAAGRDGFPESKL